MDSVGPMSNIGLLANHLNCNFQPQIWDLIGGKWRILDLIALDVDLIIIDQDLRIFFF